MKRFNQDIPWDLIISSLKGDISESQRQELNLWLNRDVNVSLYAELSSLWDQITVSSSSVNTNIEQRWAELQKRITKNNNRRFIAFGRGRMSVQRAVRYASVIILMLISTTVYITKESLYRPTNDMQTYQTLTGKSRITLPDGSVVTLNNNTTLSYDGGFGDKTRKVSVQGEALFDVTKDAKRKFIVESEGISIVVIGTKFNVNTGRDNKMTVSLIDGVVSLNLPDSHYILSPGDRAVYDKHTKLVVIEKPDIMFETIWAETKIRIENKTLAELADYFESWYGISVNIDPAIPNNQAYTFTITDDSLEDILTIMSKLHPIEYKIEKDSLTITNKP